MGAGGVAATTNVANQNQIGTVTLSGAGSVAGDALTGNLVIDGTTFNAATGAGTLTALAAAITASGLGISATVNGAAVGAQAAGTILTLVSNGPASEGATFAQTIVDTITAGTTAVQDTPAVGLSDYYSMAVSGSLNDTSTGGGALNVGMVADNNGAGGVATTSYSDGAGSNLSTTDLTSQVNAEVALNELNVAISDVASMDGYIGAQINTLNSLSQVMSTQQENVVSAQNAVQATDYASATSNMSKYEILSQTGIAALAQANQVQQEVTKLLQ